MSLATPGPSGPAPAPLSEVAPPARPAAAGGRRARSGLIAYAALRQAADVCQGTAVAWLLAAGTNSPAVVGAASSLGVVPWLALPLTGLLGDRAPRRLIIRTADSAALVLGALLALALARRHLGVGLGLGWVTAYAALYSVARPAGKGLAREVDAAPAGAARLSGALTAIEYAVIGAGQLLAALLLLAGHAPAAFAATAALLALGLAVLPAAGTPAGAGGPARERVPLAQTASALARAPFAGPFAVTVLCGCCAFTVQALAPLLALRHLHAGVLGFAVLAAANSLGSAAGALWVRRGARWRSGARGAALAWLAAAPAAALAGLAHGLLPAAGAFAVLGAATGFQDAGNAARVAALIPAEAQSSAMALGSLVWRTPRLMAGAMAALGVAVPLGALCTGLAAAQAALAAGAWWRTAAGARVTGAGPRAAVGD